MTKQTIGSILFWKERSEKMNDLEDLDTDFDFAKKSGKTTKKSPRAVPKIDFQNDKITDLLKWRVLTEQVKRYKSIFGLTVEDLANEAKVSRPTVLKLLHGDSTIHVDNVLKILSALEYRRKKWFKTDAE